MRLLYLVFTYAFLFITITQLVVGSNVGDACSGNAALCNTPGHYCSVGNSCQLVPIGEYSNTNGMSINCGTGYTTVNPGEGAGANAQVACKCNTGYGRSSNASPCAQCVSGMFKSTVGDIVCTNVSPGKFAADSGSNQVSIGATQEVNCPSGYWSAGSVAQCTQSVAGYYTANAGGSASNSGATQTLACGSGTYSSSAGSTECIPAQAGKCSANANNLCTVIGGIKEESCGAGYWSSNQSGVCTSCGTGYTTVNPGEGAGANAQVACKCDTGYGRLNDSTECYSCVPGYYKSSVDDVVCTPCSVGKYFDSSIAYDGTIDQCTSCGTGYTSNLGATAIDAQQACICDVGYGRSDGSKLTPCEICGYGKYKIATGDMECNIAPTPINEDTSGLNKVAITDYYWFDKIIPAAIISTNEIIIEIRWAFLCGLFLLIIMFLFEKIILKQSPFGGPKAARFSLFILVIIIIIHIITTILFLYWSVNYNNMVARTSWPRLLVGTKYEMSYIQHYPRAVTSLVFVTIGLGAGYHPLLAILCILASILDLICSIISCIEMRDYLNQCITMSAPLGGDWTKNGIMLYYYRDLFSIALSSCIIFTALHVMIIMGYITCSCCGSGSSYSRRLLTYDQVGGVNRSEFDVSTNMRVLRDRQLMKRVIEGKRHKNVNDNSDGNDSGKLFASFRDNDDERNVYYGDEVDSDDEHQAVTADGTQTSGTKQKKE
jgi:hypothetical protein